MRKNKVLEASWRPTLSNSHQHERPPSLEMGWTTGWPNINGMCHIVQYNENRSICIPCKHCAAHTGLLTRHPSTFNEGLLTACVDIIACARRA